VSLKAYMFACMFINVTDIFLWIIEVTGLPHLFVKFAGLFYSVVMVAGLSYMFVTGLSITEVKVSGFFLRVLNFTALPQCHHIPVSPSRFLWVCKKGFFFLLGF
jgi:hypothetical protein